MLNLYLYAVVWVLRASEDIKVFRNACLSFEMQRKTHLLLEQHSLSFRIIFFSVNIFSIFTSWFIMLHHVTCTERRYPVVLATFQTITGTSVAVGSYFTFPTTFLTVISIKSWSTILRDETILFKISRN